jgi:hypothetical protein
MTFWALGGWSLALAPNLHWKFITGNLILEFAVLVLLLLYGAMDLALII